MQTASPLTYARAKRMRAEPSEAERGLWTSLRNRSLGGLKFYRQVPIGPYIVDFVCHERGLVIELDGETHGDDAAMAHDERRTGYLSSLGLIVHRVLNDEIYRNKTAALDGIHAQAMARPMIERENMKWLAKKGPHPPLLRNGPPSPEERVTCLHASPLEKLAPRSGD